MKIRNLQQQKVLEHWPQNEQMSTISSHKLCRTILRAQCYKTFFVRNLPIFVISQSVVRLGCKSLQGRNTQAYNENS